MEKKEDETEGDEMEESGAKESRSMAEKRASSSSSRLMDPLIESLADCVCPFPLGLSALAFLFRGTFFGGLGAFPLAPPPAADDEEEDEDEDEDDEFPLVVLGAAKSSSSFSLSLAWAEAA